MARINLSVPDDFRDEMDRVFPNRNWSAFFVSVVRQEIKSRFHPGDAPPGLDDEAIRFIADRLSQRDSVVSALKREEGCYEGFLWAKYSAPSIQALERVATLDFGIAGTPEDRSKSVGRLLRCLDRLGFEPVCLGSNEDFDWERQCLPGSLMRTTLESHWKEVGQGRTDHDLPGMWGWFIKGPEHTVPTTDFLPDHPYYEEIVDAFGPAAQGPDATFDLEHAYHFLSGVSWCNWDWARGFVEGVASVYEKVKEITKRPESESAGAGSN
jgi:hypothetical protein